MLVWSSITVTAAVPRPEAAGLAQALEVERRVELVGREQPHADAARHGRLGLPPLPDAAGVLVDQGAAGDAQRQLDADLLVHVARDAVELRARSSWACRST